MASHDELRETFALVVCSRVKMRGMMWNSSCLGWKSGRQDEARGSGVIPRKISAKSDSFESSDERALPADLLSCPAGGSRAFKHVFTDHVSGLSICDLSSAAAAASILSQDVVFLSAFTSIISAAADESKITNMED